MRSSPVWLILAGLMIMLDFYVFQGIKTVSQQAGARARTIIAISYWTVSIFSLVVLFVLPYLNLGQSSRSVRSVIFALIIALFLGKLIAAVFFLIDDIRRGVQWLAGKVFFRNTEGEQFHEGEGISRSVFLSWLGLGLGGGLFTSLIYGFSNKYDYRVRKVKLQYPNLPEAFRGLRVVQISDIHSGSLTDRDAVNRGVDHILSLKPDLVLFTGDLVNDQATELNGFHDIFSRLTAPMGVYSVLGNHDYGDYHEWPDKQTKMQNLEKLKQLQGDMGWKLLMNEHVILDKNNQQIALLGIENWSNKGRFPKYGKLSQAYAGTENIPFKILMSHDPSHWDAEVRKEYQDIDLMLSGHTHGMQFGVELPGVKWSPVQYMYRQWAGLYEEGRQKLYVNRGFGFIGYPGRVGILPEITLIELA